MSSQPTYAQQQQVLNEVRQQAQAQMMQEIMTKMSEKCFKVTLYALFIFMPFNFCL
jgi:23S rRNA maturation mini-RNase III